jgi:hypothetical protein
VSATCRSCRQPVIWCLTLNRKKMPVDPDPVPEGNLIMIDPIEPGDIPMVVAKANPDVPGWTSHFATCPDADAHRKPR